MEKERFKMPSPETLLNIAALFTSNNIKVKELANIISVCQFVLDRLYDNGDISIPSKKENEINYKHGLQ